MVVRVAGVSGNSSGASIDNGDAVVAKVRYRWCFGGSAQIVCIVHHKIKSTNIVNTMAIRMIKW